MFKQHKLYSWARNNTEDINFQVKWRGMQISEHNCQQMYF